MNHVECAKCVETELLYVGPCARGHKVRVAFCKTCGYVHLFPKPTPEETEKYYKNSYYQTEKPKYMQQQDERARFLKLVLEEKISESQFRLDDQQVLLDVGCGQDYRWFCAMKSRNPNSVWFGLEPSAPDGGVQPADNACIQNSWESLDKSRERYLGKGQLFDRVNMSFVLEHTPNPREILIKVFARMKPGASLYVEVPWDFNENQLAIRRKKENAWWVSSPDHIIYWTPEDLSVILRECGFTVGKHRSTYPVEHFILDGADYRKGQKQARYALNHGPERQQLWWESGYSKTKTGRTFWLIARKDF